LPKSLTKAFTLHLISLLYDSHLNSRIAFCPERLSQELKNNIRKHQRCDQVFGSFHIVDREEY